MPPIKPVGMELLHRNELFRFYVPISKSKCEQIHIFRLIENEEFAFVCEADLIYLSTRLVKQVELMAILEGIDLIRGRGNRK